MELPRIKQRPVRLTDGKRGVRTQFAALCWRLHKDDVQILLVTSRRQRRWIIPKGWPVDDSTPVEAAQEEAWEEGGVIGKARPTCLGIYSYTKVIRGEDDLPCIVAVFPVKVKKVRREWPEMDERRRKWVSRRKAAKMVNEPELSAIIAAFDPKQL